MNRVALAIRSNIPDEMDWALQSLVRMSFDSPDDLSFTKYPSLAPALLEKLGAVDQFASIDACILRLEDGTVIEETDDDMGLGLGSQSVVRKRLDKVLEAALVLRNATINPDNARVLSMLKVCQVALIKCLSLPERPSLVELRQYALDITESVAFFLRPTSSEDTLFQILIGYLDSDDRGVLIAAMRAVARLVISVELNLLQSINPKLISRISALILLDDEELLTVCLDFLYQYTSNSDNIELTADKIDWRDPIQQLIRLLLFQAREWPSVDRPIVPQPFANRQPPPQTPPLLPLDLITELLQFPEPDRAIRWMRVCFEEDEEADVTQITLWKAYESCFEDYARQGKKLLPAADFIKNVTMAFRQAAAMVVTTPNGQQKFIIKGIRPRQMPLSLKGELYIACQWDMGAETRCSGVFPSVKDLFLHILAVHLPAPLNPSMPIGETSGRHDTNGHANGKLKGEPLTNAPLDLVSVNDDKILTPEKQALAPKLDDQMTDGPAILSTVGVATVEPNDSSNSSTQTTNPDLYFCHWGSCMRFALNGEPDRYKVAEHVKTHIPDPESNRPDLPSELKPEGVAESRTLTSLDAINMQKMILVNRSTLVDDRGDATGVPLTAVLILRNIARSDTGRSLLKGFEHEVINVAAVNVPLRNYIVDLLDFIEEHRTGIV
ncbi:uncharacterized protein V1518DRAFT_409270 [Limtongia smithiae]|uniref:uncharacterized protein n=1 Tax=Limtongia smithiae TaxID=1125753 RepID=UPI0034CE6362